MEKITITREEFRQRVVENPRGFAIVRAIRDNPEKFNSTPMTQMVEELTQKIALLEIEEELFGPEEKHDNA